MVQKSLLTLTESGKNAAYFPQNEMEETLKTIFTSPERRSVLDDYVQRKTAERRYMTHVKGHLFDFDYTVKYLLESGYIMEGPI